MAAKHEAMLAANARWVDAKGALVHATKSWCEAIEAKRNTVATAPGDARTNALQAAEMQIASASANEAAAQARVSEAEVTRAEAEVQLTTARLQNDNAATEAMLWFFDDTQKQVAASNVETGEALIQAKIRWFTAKAAVVSTMKERVEATKQKADALNSSRGVKTDAIRALDLRLNEIEGTLAVALEEECVGVQVMAEKSALYSQSSMMHPETKQAPLLSMPFPWDVPYSDSFAASTATATTIRPPPETPVYRGPSLDSMRLLDMAAAMAEPEDDRLEISVVTDIVKVLRHNSAMRQMRLIKSRIDNSRKQLMLSSWAINFQKRSKQLRIAIVKQEAAADHRILADKVTTAQKAKDEAVATERRLRDEAMEQLEEVKLEYDSPLKGKIEKLETRLRSVAAEVEDRHRSEVIELAARARNEVGQLQARLVAAEANKDEVLEELKNQSIIYENREAEVSGLENDRDRASRLAATAQQDVENAKFENEQVISDMKRMKAESTLELQRLRDENRKLLAQWDTEKSDALRYGDELTKLKFHHEMLQKEQEQIILNAQDAMDQKNQILGALHRLQAETSHSINDRDGALKTAERAKEDRDSVMRQLESVMEELNATQSETVDAKTTRDRAKKSSELNMESLKRLQAETELMIDERDRAKQTAAHVQEDMAHMKLDFNQMKEEMDRAKREGKAAKEDHALAERQYRDMLADRDVAKRSAERAEDEAAGLKSELHNAIDARDRAQRDNQTMRHELALAKLEIDTVSKDLDTVRASDHARKQSFARLEGMQSKEHREKETMARAIQNANETMLSMKEENERLEAGLSALKTENNQALTDALASMGTFKMEKAILVKEREVAAQAHTLEKAHLREEHAHTMQRLKAKHEEDLTTFERMHHVEMKQITAAHDAAVSKAKESSEKADTLRAEFAVQMDGHEQRMNALQYVAKDSADVFASVREELDATELDLRHCKTQLTQKAQLLEEQILLTEEQKMLRIADQERQIQMLEEQTRNEQERQIRRMQQDELRHTQDLFTLADNDGNGPQTGNGWMAEGSVAALKALTDPTAEVVHAESAESDLGEKRTEATTDDKPSKSQSKPSVAMPRFSQRGTNAMRLRLAARQYKDNEGQRPAPHTAIHTRK